MVNSSSEEVETVVNGMSYSGRDSANANSAIVVSIPVTDYPSDHPLAGIEYQRKLERKAFEAANGKIPAQRYGDFKNLVCEFPGECSISGPVGTSDIAGGFAPVFKGSYEWCDLSEIFADNINEMFISGMTHFGKVINGFDSPETIMAGVESRTSSPVRIPRDDKLQASIEGIIPVGEGAGYAGGITSAAMDGIRGAEMIIGKYKV